MAPRKMLMVQKNSLVKKKKISNSIFLSFFHPRLDRDFWTRISVFFAFGNSCDENEWKNPNFGLNIFLTTQRKDFWPIFLNFFVSLRLTNYSIMISRWMYGIVISVFSIWYFLPVHFQPWITFFKMIFQIFPSGNSQFFCFTFFLEILFYPQLKNFK